MYAIVNNTHMYMRVKNFAGFLIRYYKCTSTDSVVLRGKAPVCVQFTCMTPPLQSSGEKLHLFLVEISRSAGGRWQDSRKRLSQR